MVTGGEGTVLRKKIKEMILLEKLFKEGRKANSNNIP